LLVNLDYNSKRRFMPVKAAYHITRAKNVANTLGFFKLSRSQADMGRRLLLTALPSKN
jgi:hypothetical protein